MIRLLNPTLLAIVEQFSLTLKPMVLCEAFFQLAGLVNSGYEVTLENAAQFTMIYGFWKNDQQILLSTPQMICFL